ncbi:MAG TPA: ferredoxin family protein [Methanobacteriaceae archaeon]|jgi:NAD-dependent dihydropyrimidine dehydrogenase PreA subunit|nr:ferredoxin family protein [Euryarchaeota archaeon]HNR25297.1 ferredoxin family protein [Methanobacteriaceae archaeon]
MRIEVDLKKCTGCGVCREECPKGARIWNINEKARASNLRYCHLCMICASKCPEDAIRVIRDEIPNDENKKENLGN